MNVRLIYDGTTVAEWDDATHIPLWIVDSPGYWAGKEAITLKVRPYE